MPARSAFDYAVIRVVPRVERDEFVNAGVVLHAPTRRFLGCAIALDSGRLLALHPQADIPELSRHLQALRAICAGAADAGPIGRMPVSERFHWIVAPRNTMIQVSPVHAGLSEDPEATLHDLVERLVR